MKRGIAKRRGLQSHKLIARKRRKMIFWVLFSISVPLLIISAISFVSYLSVIQINTITVIGNQTISASAITPLVEQVLAKEDFYYIFSKNTVFNYDKMAIASSVSAYSQRIKNVQIQTKGLHTVIVSLHERTEQGLWCTEDKKCQWADEDGLLFEDASSTVFSASSTYYFKGYAEGNKIPYMYNGIAFVEGLKNIRSQLHPISIDITPEADATIATQEGVDLKISLADDPASRLDALSIFLSDATLSAKIVKKQVKYIDLRFGNKIYYKPIAGVSEKTKK